MDYKSTLPPLPTGTERQHSWVVIAAEPLLVLPLREGDTEPIRLDIDPDWIDARVADYADLTSSGHYEAAHLVEHSRAGTRGGDVVELSAWRDPRDARTKLLAHIRWVAGVDAEAAVDAGVLRYASPSWGSFTDELGKLWEFALAEVSAVVSPHQKHMAPSHYLSEAGHVSSSTTTAITPITDTENTMAETQLMEEPDESAEPTIADLAAKLSSLMERMNLMEAGPAEKEEEELGEEEEEDAEELSEVAALRAELAEMRDLSARSEFAKGAQAVLGACGDAVVEAAYQLSQQDATSFDTLVQHLTQNKPAARIERAASKYRWNLGSTEGKPVAASASLSRQACAEKARAEKLSNDQYVALVRANGHEI